MSATSASVCGSAPAGIFHQHECQAKRFVAKLAADHAIGLRRAVAFVEEQIQHVKHAMHTPRIDALNLGMLAQARRARCNRL